MSILFKRIKDWAISITAFRTGDVIPVDGPSGTAKMSKDSLLGLTTDTALVDNLAPKFDPTKPNDDGGYAYYAGASVLYNGRNYVFTVNHRSGPWNFSEVEQKPLSSVVDFGSVGEAVNTWLEEHPEATTTVQDGSLTEAKFSDALKLKTIKDYVTPEMFGAVGDGVTDDTAAIQAAIDSVEDVKETKVVLTARTYAIYSNLYIPGHTTICGSNKNQIQLHDNASIVLGKSNSIAYEIRLSNFSVFGNDSSDYCIRNFSDESVISQCFFENLYFDHATIAALKIRGSIIFFDSVYAYYSAIGAIFRGNAIYLDNCNFWDNGATLSLNTSFSKFTNCWFEGGTGTLGSNNIQIRHESGCQAFFEGCCFQGSSATTQKVMWDTEEFANKSGSFFFIHCRINYPGATGGIFKVTTLSPNQMRLRFSQCYLYAPSGDFFIDNSEAAISSFSYQANACGGIGRDMCSNETTHGISMDVSQDWRGTPHLLSGVVIGQKKPAIDAVINSEYEGYLRYDLSLHRLLLQSDGTQKPIPLRANTFITRLQHNNGVTIDTLIDKINELLVVLGNEASVLPYYTGV